MIPDSGDKLRNDDGDVAIFAYVVVPAVAPRTLHDRVVGLPLVSVQTHCRRRDIYHIIIHTNTALATCSLRVKPPTKIVSIAHV